MGNKTSSPTVNSTLTQANFHPEVEVLEKSHHDPHYGEVKVVRDVKNASKYVLKEIIHHTQKSFDADLAFFSKRVTVKHPNVVDIIGFNTLAQSHLCANHFKITLFIEHVDRNLKADLDVRRTTNQPYSDNEILSIADDVVSGLAYFQQQNISHGDIRPLNIFVKNGTCKLSDPSLNAERGFGSLVKSIISGTKTLPSPLILQQISSHKFEPAGNPFKNDVFSLGATLLALATLTNSEDFYDYKKGKLDEVLIEQRLQIVQRTRPPAILELIRDMLTLNELKRPDPLALLQRIHALRGGARPVTTVPTVVPQTYIAAPQTYLPPQTYVAPQTYVPQTVPLETVKRSYVAPTSTVYTAPVTTTVVSDDLEARIKAALERSEATFRAVNAAPTTTTTTLPTTTIAPTQYSYPVEGVRRSGVGVTTYPTSYTTAPVEGLRRSGVGISSYPVSSYPVSTYPTSYTTAPVEGLRRSGVGMTTYAPGTYVPYTGNPLTRSGVTVGTVLPGLTTGVTTGLPTTGLTTDANPRKSSDASPAGYTSGGYSTYANQANQPTA